jgi:hypothetical protein
MRPFAIVLLVVTAAVHFYLAPEHLEEMPYIGVLFILGGAGSLLAAGWLLVRDTEWAWAAGGVVCAGMLVALVLSRTTGLPDFKEEGLEPLAVVCLVVEALFLAVWVVAHRRLSATSIVTETARPAAVRRAA